MGHTDAVCLNIMQKLTEIAITQFAGRHLYTDVVHTGIEFCIEVCTMQGDALLGAEFDTERFVTVRLTSTEMKVAMARLYPIAHILKDKEQRNTVCTAREGHKVLSVLMQQCMLLDEAGNGMLKRCFVRHKWTCLSLCQELFRTFQVLGRINTDGLHVCSTHLYLITTLQPSELFQTLCQFKTALWQLRYLA